MKIVKKILALNFFFLFAFAVIIPSVSAEARYGRVLIVGKGEYEPVMKSFMKTFVGKRCFTAGELAMGLRDRFAYEPYSGRSYISGYDEDISDEATVNYKFSSGDTGEEFDLELVVVIKVINPDDTNCNEINEEYKKADVIFYFFDNVNEVGGNFRELRSVKENNTFREWYEHVMRLKTSNFQKIDGNFTMYYDGPKDFEWHTIPEKYRSMCRGLPKDGKFLVAPPVDFEDPSKIVNKSEFYRWYCDNCPNKFFINALCISEEGLKEPQGDVRYQNRTYELIRALPNVQHLFYTQDASADRFCVIEALGRFCGMVNRLGHGPFKKFFKICCLFI
ncbi:MAG: hypothetical protein CfP315_0553 [Candidatus Improbicoccus pseudotrichonymphae]|uniref:Uncharacterized protein n=1 Tax=Candidatus Improbicoccus pseudotrichonymphae TaxID=3033792 RepID=A0AA48KVJ5_9FIRM|nr:MAG: hypothetical protein CfP315_0553 [Candidatus Improbicoccus pseudotrichonymphae]